MLFHYLATLYMSLHLPSTCAHTFSKYNNEELTQNTLWPRSFHDNVNQAGFHPKSLESRVHYSVSSEIRSDNDGKVTSDFRSFGGQNLWHHHQYHIRTVHGILCFIGWGILLPIGVIISRYFRVQPMRCENWLQAHIFCQSMGYVLGTIGWGTTLWIGNTCKSCISKTSKILGAFVFSLASVQILSVLPQPKKEDEYSKRWKICHRMLGYVLISLIVAYIFKVADHQSQATMWKWTYVGFLGAMAFIAMLFEICKWVKARSH